MRTLELNSIEITGEIYDAMGYITSKSTYVNNLKNPIEVKYTFCLDSNAVVDSLKIKIGERESIGVVQEKKQAANTYSTAMKENKTACILEKYDDIYTVTVGNIEPEDKLEITYTYMTNLGIEDGKYKFVLPNNVGERYGAFIKNGYFSSFDEKSQQVANVNNFLMNIRCLSQEKIKNVFSLTSTLITNRISNNEVTITTVTFPNNGDFNLFLETENLPCLYISENKESLYGMITHKIECENVDENIPREYIFLLDRSGSMDGKNIEDAKNALVQTIKLLNNNSYFNVVSFGSDYSAMFQKSVKSDEYSKNIAVETVGTYEANMGGTEIYECIKAHLDNDLKIYELTNKNFADLIFLRESNTEIEKVFIFLTDGQIYDLQPIYDLIKKANFRMFTIGIGKSASRDLIEQMAYLTNGKSRMIMDSELIIDVVSNIMKVVNTKHYINLSVIVDGNLIDTVGHKTIYPGEVVTLFFKLDKDLNNYPNHISITGFHKNEQKQWHLNMDSETNSETNSKANQANRVKIPTELVEKLYHNQLIKEKLVTDKQIIQISVKYNIMNLLTSFVVVDNFVHDRSNSSALIDDFNEILCSDYQYRRQLSTETDNCLEGGIDMFGGGSKEIAICDYDILNYVKKDGSYEINQHTVLFVFENECVFEQLIQKYKNEDRNILFNIAVFIYINMMTDKQKTQNYLLNLTNWLDKNYPNYLNEMKKIKQHVISPIRIHSVGDY